MNSHSLNFPMISLSSLLCLASHAASLPIPVSPDGAKNSDIEKKAKQERLRSVDLKGKIHLLGKKPNKTPAEKVELAVLQDELNQYVDSSALQFNLLAGFRNSNLYRATGSGTGQFGKKGALSMEAEQFFPIPEKKKEVSRRVSLFGALSVYGNQEAKYKPTSASPSEVQKAITAADGFDAHIGASIQIKRFSNAKLTLDAFVRSYFTMLSKPLLNEDGTPRLDPDTKQQIYEFHDQLQSATDYGLSLRTTIERFKGSLFEAAWRNHDPAFPLSPRRLVVRARGAINVIPTGMGSDGFFNDQSHAWYFEALANRSWGTSVPSSRDEVVLSVGYMYRF